MPKTILIAGKDLPDGDNFIAGAAGENRRISAATSSFQQKPVFDEQLAAIPWLRTSPISSRTLVLQTENQFSFIDEAILYFDESYFASKFNSFSIENCSSSTDAMILGFHYLTIELLNRFEQTMNMDDMQENTYKKLVFLLKNSPNESEILRTPSLRNIEPYASNCFTAAAAAAFQAFAENIAAVYGGREYVSVILIKADHNNEVAKKDSALSSWLCSYLDDVEKLKSKPSAKQSTAWIKAGTKSTGLSFFSR